MAEEVRQIQGYSQVAGLPVIINNTYLMKHRKLSRNNVRREQPLPDVSGNSLHEQRRHTVSDLLDSVLEFTGK